MKKLSLKLTGIKQVLKKEEMKKIKGGGLGDCIDECSSFGSCWGAGSCQPSSCYHNGVPYMVCG
ncbi:MAG: hypothetical protein AAGC65_05665 [Mucilaginibacter sp.]|uniref:hypothetical protein n=1 Tax=Mucilaginibacter sp. TaxID=1882438 RepID=UPI0031B26CF5